MKQVPLSMLALLIAGHVLSTPIKADDLEPAAFMKAFGVKGDKVYSDQWIAGYGENKIRKITLLTKIAPFPHLKSSAPEKNYI